MKVKTSQLAVLGVVCLGLAGCASPGPAAPSLAVMPGKASIAVWSPGLNASGNSELGTRALEMLAREMGWSVFRAR